MTYWSTMKSPLQGGPTRQWEISWIRRMHRTREVPAPDICTTSYTSRQQPDPPLAVQRRRAVNTPNQGPVQPPASPGAVVEQVDAGLAVQLGAAHLEHAAPHPPLHASRPAGHVWVSRTARRPAAAALQPCGVAAAVHTNHRRPLHSPGQHIVAPASQPPPLEVAADGDERHRPVQQDDAAGIQQKEGGNQAAAGSGGGSGGSSGSEVIPRRSHALALNRALTAPTLPFLGTGQVPGASEPAQGRGAAAGPPLPACSQCQDRRCVIRTIPVTRTCPERWASGRPWPGAAAPPYRLSAAVRLRGCLQITNWASEALHSRCIQVAAHADNGSALGSRAVEGAVQQTTPEVNNTGMSGSEQKAPPAPQPE